MGTRYTPETMQGIIVPDVATYWNEESGQYTGAAVRIGDVPYQSPIAGDPVPALASQMRLRASGEQTDDEIVICNRRGLPVLDECGVLRRRAKDGNQDHRGRELPQIPLRTEHLLPAGSCTSPHAVTMHDDSVLVCWWRSGTGVQVQRREAGGSLTAAATAHGSTLVVDLHPCLVRMPTAGHVRLYYWRATGADWQIGTRLSRDYGSTWSAHYDALTEAITGATLTSVGRLRAVYWRGMIGLTAGLLYTDLGGGAPAPYRNRIAQYSSSDGGGILLHVATQDGSAEEYSGVSQDMAVLPGGAICLIARVRWDTTAGSAVVAISRVASARMSLDLAGEESDTTGLNAGQYLARRTGGGASDYRYSDSDCALWVDDDGAVYLAVRRCDTAAMGIPGVQACFVLRSADQGLTWTTTGDSDVIADRGQAWYWDEVGASYPTRFAATAQRGRTILAGDYFRSTTGAIDNTITLWYLGGWQSRTMPPADVGTLAPTRRVAWMRPQCAIDFPDVQGWTLTTVGAPAIGRTNGRITVTTAAGESVTYHRTGAMFSTANGAILEVALEADTIARLRIEAYDAAPLRYSTEVRITATTVQLWDLGGAVQIGATHTRTANGRIRVRLDQAGSSAECRVFEGDSTSEDRLWVLVGTTAALVNAGAFVNDTIAIEFGASTTGWLDEWDAVWGSYCGQHQIGQSVNERMPGCVVPSGCWAGSGVRLSAITGPAEIEDQWTIARSWQYPPQAILPRVTPSPRSGLRIPTAQLEATAVEVRVSFKLATTESYPHGTLYGALFDAARLGGGAFYVDYGGAWHLVGNQGRYGYVATRRGATLRVQSGGVTYSAVLRRGELVGAHLELVSGGGPTSNYQASVARSDRGYINTTAGTSYPLTVTVDDPLVGAPASPTVRVYPPRVLMLADLAALQPDILGWQIRFPVHPGAGPHLSPGPPSSGYYEIGSACVGPVILLGSAYDWGRRQRTEPGTKLTTTRDGTRIADVERPSRRSVSLSWAGGVPLGRHETEDAPDYVAAYTGGPAAGMRWDVPLDLGDLLVEIDGAAVPVAYLPSVRQDDSGGSDHYARGAVLGRIVVESLDTDVVRGDELVDEVVRVQDWTVEEET